MIYTIGYQNLINTNALIKRLREHEITVLLDVRSKPYSRKPAFNKNRLQPSLQAAGIHYKWCGRQLGGFSSIAEQDIKELADYVKRGDQKICLMCMEADPSRCHRHYEIGRRLVAYKIKTQHI